MGYEFVLKFYKWQYRSAQERFYFISTINSNCLEFLLTNSISSYNSSKIVWERRFSLGKSRPIPSSIDAEYQNWGLSTVMILTCDWNASYRRRYPGSWKNCVNYNIINVQLLRNHVNASVNTVDFTSMMC